MADRELNRPIEDDRPRIELASPPSVARGDFSSARLYPAQPIAQSYGAGTGEEVHLLDYVRVLHKRRWTALTAFLVVMLSVTIYTFTATPIYEARVQLLIEPENPNVVTFKEVIEQNQAASDYFQTQYRILASRALARRTLEALKLWHHFEFGGDPSDQPLSVSRAVGDGLSWVRGWFRSGGHADASEETAAQSRSIDRFLGSLDVSPIRNSRLVDVKYQSSDSTLAATVANTLARVYVEQNHEYKFLASKEASDWLGERLAEQRKQVEAAEASLQRYRESNDVSLGDRENIVVQKLADLNAAVTRAKTERIEKEALYNQLRAIQNDRAALDTFPAILSNPFIQSLKVELAGLQRQQAQRGERLLEQHPEMIALTSAIQSAEARLQGEVAKVVQSVRNEYLAAQSQERSLMGALDTQKSDALALNRKGIEYGVLQREAESSRQIHDGLLQRAKETGVSSELRTSNVRIVDPAERPRLPARPRRGLNLLLGLLGGLSVGVTLAFFIEYLDNRMKSPDEIRSHLGLPTIGLLPALGDQHSLSEYPLVSNGAPTGFVEGFRAVRTNILFSSAEQGPRSLLVTSTAPGEGKTIIACNLAVSLAQAGQHVLLIDADMRKPRLQDAFGVSQEPGLSNLLVGNTKASESIRKGPVQGLWLLPAGRTPPNPAELLGSPRFKTVLKGLGEHFDWVLLDSPPVMAVTDAAVVAHNCSGVLFVVGAEVASRQAAQAALERLASVHARFVGAVLNRVNLDRDSYYYRPYYRREYGDYYISRPAS